MANGSEALDVLTDEISAAIADIKTENGARSCGAHDAMARGVIVLLRCQQAHISAAKQTMTIAGATSALVSAFVWAIGYLCQLFSGGNTP